MISDKETFVAQDHTQQSTEQESSAGDRVNLVDLHRSYGPILALDGFTLDIAPGELVVLLGPSGCGKTTALRALAGLEELDSGRLVVGGRDITHLSANRRNMGMVFQAYSLFPNMTARDNVAYGLRLRRIHARARRARADELLELVGLGAHANHYPSQLSGGQQQRVALARALAIRPRVLLLDEPLSALDAKVRAQLRDEIRRIQKEVGTSTLFVTHDQEEALAVADRVGVMQTGRLEQIAAPSELYEKPKSAFVAGFVGLSNRLNGVVDNGSAKILDTGIPLLDGSPTSGEVTVFVRPESMEVTPDRNGNGQVTTTSFLGSICHAKIQLDDGTSLVAQIPKASISTVSSNTRVQVSVQPISAFATPRGSETP